MEERKIVVRRMLGLIGIAGVIFGLYTLRLIFLQLIHGDEFAAQATSTTEYNFTVTAARGDIVDSYGRRIATSTTCYNLVLNKLLMGSSDLNETLQELVLILQENGESWNDGLLIGMPDAQGHYEFTGDPESTSDQNALSSMKESLGLQQYATADEVMEKMVEDYKLEEYELSWQRVLAGWTLFPTSTTSSWPRTCRTRR